MTALVNTLKKAVGWIVGLGLLFAGVFFVCRWRVADSQQQAALTARAEMLRDKTLASAREAKRARAVADAHGERAEQARQSALQRIERLQKRGNAQMAKLVKSWNGA